MAGFDIAAARKAGYSDTEIADFLGQQSKFDVAGARQAGYSDADVISHLAGTPAPKAAPQPAQRPAAITAGDVGNALLHAPGQIASNFAADYTSREKGARNALVDDIGSIGKPSKSVMPVGVKTAMDAVNWLSSPFMAAGDQIVGRPVEIATGGKLPHQAVTDVVSVLTPLGEGVAAERALAKAADAAGMSITAYQKMLAARTATQNALAATAKAQQAAAKPPGPIARAAAPFKARASDAAAQQQAGDVLSRRASDVEAVKGNLAKGADVTVPGSVPTTGQQTGDMGLLSLEREQATKNPVPFRERAGEQNAARVDALKGVQSGGDVTQVAGHFRAMLDDLDHQTDADVTSAQAGAQQLVDNTTAAHDATVGSATAEGQAKTTAMGGAQTPDAYGETLRSGLVSANNAAKGRVSALYQAVDPEGNLTANVGPTRDAAKAIAGEMRPTTAPMSGPEAHVFEVAQAMPATAPARDLMDLGQQVSALKIAEQRSAGDTPTYRRLSMLHDAIKSNLANAVSDKAAADDVAVKAGTMAPEQALSARIQAQVNGWKQDRVAARSNDGGADLANSASGTPRVPGPVGTAGEAGGGLGGAAGNPGVSSAPTFDEAAAGRLNAANAAHAERKGTFGVDPVRSVLATNGVKGDFRLPDGQVPGKFFHPGPAGFEHVQSALKASPDALPVLQDYAAMSLKRAAMRDDGTIDPAKFQRWTAAHQDALRALPADTQTRFADAAQAGQAVSDAVGARTAAIKAAQSQAASDVATAVAARKAAMTAAQRAPTGRVGVLSEPQDITRTIGTILGGKTAVADMKALANEARSNPDAVAGLRQAVADHISSNYLGNTEVAASGQSGIKADAFQTFLRKNGDALSAVFSPEEMGSMRSIAADIQRSKRSENAVKLPGGSNTTQDTLALAKSAPSRVSRSLLDIFGAILGHGAGAVFGPMGSTLGGLGGAAAVDYLQGLRAAGIRRVDDLVTRAMLDPELARTLLERVPETPAAKATFKAKASDVFRALGAAGATSAVSATSQADRGRPYGPATEAALR
jgi:hypothetical protein